MIKNKKALSAVVATVVLIAITLVVVGVVWGVVSNLVNDELEGVGSCVDIFDKVQINDRYTCYNSSSNELQFSLSIGEIEIDKVLLSISSQGATASFEINNTAVSVSGVTNYPGGSSSIILPKKNAGLTYVYNLSVGGFSAGPDSLEIFPKIGKKQCGNSDTISEFPKCSSLL